MRFMKVICRAVGHAWHDTWYENLRKRHLLKAAAARLIKPKVAAACKSGRKTGLDLPDQVCPEAQQNSPGHSRV